MIPQRLIRINVFSKSVTSNELARVLNEDLRVEVEIGPNSLIAAMRDRAGVNQATLNRIQCIFPNLLNAVCFSHTLDNVSLETCESDCFTATEQNWCGKI